MNELLDFLFKHKKITLGVLGTIIIAIFASFIVYSIINAPKTVTLEVSVAPFEADIEVGDYNFSNGTYKIEPGIYDVRISKEGFETFTKTFEVKSGDTYKLFMCLEGDKSNFTSEELDICEKYAQTEDEIWKTDHMKDPIYSIVPYYDERARFDITAEYQEDASKIQVKVYLNSCAEEAIVWYKSLVRQYFEQENVDIDNYNVIYSTFCDTK